MGNIGDVNGDLPAKIGWLHLDGVVEIASIIGINRDDVPSPKILAAFQIGLRDQIAKLFGLGADGFGKIAWQAVLVNHREHIHSGSARCAQHLHDAPLGIDMAVFPPVELGHNLVTRTRFLRRRDIEIAREAGIIGNDVKEIFGFLKGADNRRASPLENA